MEETFRRIIREEIERARGEMLALLRSELLGPAVRGEDVIAIPAAAARFGISAKTITRWRDEGRLTRYGDGRLARVDPSEVRQIMLEMAKRDKSAPSDEDIRAKVLAKLG